MTVGELKAKAKLLRAMASRIVCTPPDYCERRAELLAEADLCEAQIKGAVIARALDRGD